MSNVRLGRPLSIIVGCAIASAGIASGLTAVVSWSLLATSTSCPTHDEGTAAAEAAAMRVLELANAEYDEALVRDEDGDAAAAETRWMGVRDRYRLFLAYPEALARWPELAAFAQERADQLAEYVDNLAEMQRLEAMALALEAEAASPASD